MTSLQFFSFVEQRLVAQIANFGQNDPKVAKQPCRHWFWHDDGPFFAQKNTVDKVDDKVDDGVKSFNFFNFWIF
jgi:hypothetical protein